MHQSKELQQKIQAHLPLHGARLSFVLDKTAPGKGPARMARFVMAVIVVRGVTLTLSTVASALNPDVLPESNEKRIKRFFGKVALEGKSFAALILALLPVNDKLVLTLDRTTWDSGASCVNILLLGIAYKGFTFPLLWVLLDKKGNVLDKAAPPGPVRSDTNERLALLDTLLKLVAAERIDVIVADREFTGKRWFQRLKERQLVFVMRVRNNTLIGSKGKPVQPSSAMSTSPTKTFMSLLNAALSLAYGSTWR